MSLLLSLVALLYGCESTTRLNKPFDSLVGKGSYKASLTGGEFKSPLVAQKLVNSYQLACEFEPGLETYWLQVFSPWLNRDVEYKIGPRELYKEIRHEFNQLHYLRLSLAEVELAAAEGLEIVLSGNKGEIFIWPDLAKAFLNDVAPYRAEWSSMLENRADEYMALSREMYEVRRDDFKGVTWHDSGVVEESHASLKTKIYSRVGDDGSLFHWIHVSSVRGIGASWAFFEYALDAGGHEIKISHDRDVGYAGATYEYLHLPVDREYLERYRTEPIRLKLYGSQATAEVTVPPWLVAGYLTILDEALAIDDEE